MFDVLKTDAGATYMLTKDSEGNIVAQGNNLRVSFTSPDTRLEITGKVRNQGTMRNAFPYSVGRGQRCVLFLDTGEGIEKIPGVVLR